MVIEGPTIFLNNTSTILLEPDCTATIDDFGNVRITLDGNLVKTKD